MKSKLLWMLAVLVGLMYGWNVEAWAVTKKVDIHTTDGGVAAGTSNIVYLLFTLDDPVTGAPVQVSPLGGLVSVTPYWGANFSGCLSMTKVYLYGNTIPTPTYLVGVYPNPNISGCTSADGLWKKGNSLFKIVVSDPNTTGYAGEALVGVDAR